MLSRMSYFGRLVSYGQLRRALSSGVGGKTPEIELYQYEVCPYCAKVKATMDFYKVPYSTVEVNPLSKKELEKFKDYKKVPQALIDGDRVIESDVIMDRVRDLKEKSPPTETELKWRKWANETFAVCLPPNLYRSFGESWDSFKYISRNNKFSSAQSLYVRSVGSVFMRMLKSRMMKKHGIEDERRHLDKLLTVWVDEAIRSKQFENGDSQPGVGDLAVFGMVRSMTGVPTFDFVMENGKFKTWYDRMESTVGPTARLAVN